MLARSAALCLLAGVPRIAGAVEPLSDHALQQISALQGEKASRSAIQLRMDSQLVYALKQSRGEPFAPGITNLRIGARAAADGRYLLDIEAEVTPGLLDWIARSGGQVISSVPRFRAVRAALPLARVESLAARAGVRFVKPAVPCIARTGSVNSQGDTTHRALPARAAFNVDGSGVKVGVLSDSVDYMTQSQATGDLPQNVTVLPGQSGIPGSGEGTAMLEIVYDLAPGAQLFYATAFGGDGLFAQNILDLRAAGCDVIIDDVFYFNESPFQDGVIARAVNTVTANGALYFSAAGNEGSEKHGTSGTWEGDFVDGGPAGAPVNGKQGNLHSFGATTYNTALRQGFATVLHWSDPLGASTNDYDLYVVDASGANVISSSTTVQNGSQDPYEIVNPPDNGERIVVVKASGDPRFLHIDTIRGRLSIHTDGNITGHAAATNAFGTAAVDANLAFPGPFTTANPVESFSTDGPRRVFFNENGTPITPGNFLATGGYVRQKPDIAAADGVSTTLPSFSGLNPFYGTSAAAPHAGAIAALVKSRDPSLTADDIRNILMTTALDNEGAGFDINSGAGIVMAYEALLSGPSLGLTVLTNLVSGGNGNGAIDPNECNDYLVVLQNVGRSTATGVRVTLSTSTPEVSIAQPSASYPNIPTGASATNTPALKVSTSSAFVCGGSIDFSLLIKTDQGLRTNTFRVATGSPAAPLRFDNSLPVPIPDADLVGTNSAVVVSGFPAAIKKAVVSLNISHTFDSDLVIQLISPGGITNNLSVNNGGSGINFGAACAPEGARTTFDDDAALPIGLGFAPFVGPYRPDQALAVFTGVSGTNVNGTWLLHVADTAGADVGTLNCWSLILTPASCTDGGGECPGADLALGMVGSPEPVTIGNNLTYTIGVTNNGPSSAKSVNVSQLLPGSVNFISANASQGSVSQAGGVVTAALGRLGPRGRATITVVVQPILTGTISSTATASSEQQDFNLNNNSATVVSHVNPVSSDVAIGLAAPAAVLLTDSLTYTVWVTNNGPSVATGITATNILPVSLVNISATVSQGSVSVLGNLVVCSFNTLAPGTRASATIHCSPTVEGNVTVSGLVIANQPDPLQGNNTASTSIVVGPAADLAISLSAVPDSVVQDGQMTYKIVVTNQGPSDATSIALSGLFAPGLTLVSNYSTFDTLDLSGFSLSGTLASLPRGGSALAVLVVNATVPSGPMEATVSVSASQSDPYPANNSASVLALVSPPFVRIAPSGAALTYESGLANGAIDLDETVSVSLSLANFGNVPTTNTTATLLAGNGVTPVGNPVQNYGSLAASGIPGSTVARVFSFTASGSYGGSVSATLHVEDAGGYSTNVSFTFALPNRFTFANASRIDIPTTAQNQLQPGPAAPYPSGLSVSGVSGLVTKATVTLSNLNHTYPHDVNVVVVGPTGLKSLLLSDAADNSSVEGADVIFDDGAPSPLPASGQITAGAWQPSGYDAGPVFSAPAPAGPYAAALSIFNGAEPNGVWSLFANDDSAGDFGAIAGGWSLSLITVTPINQVADVGVSVSVAPGSVRVGDNLTYTFTVTNAGPAAASAVMFTNVLPAGAALFSASSSQGGRITNGNLVAVSLGTLSTGAVATVTVVATATAPGPLSNSGSVVASQTDLHAADNVASVTTTVAASFADLSIGISGPTNNVIVGSNLTFAVTVTNTGPHTALNVVVTDPLPPGLVSGASSLPPGSWSNQGGTLSCSLGSLGPGATASFTITATGILAGIITNVASVSISGSSDTNGANNSASAIVTLARPGPVILAAGARLISEAAPVNGAVDPGEQVTVSLWLTNAGLLDAASVEATLQVGGGVTSSGSAQPYGLLAHGGAAVARSFTFTAANPVSGGAVVATLQLTDGGQPLGTASFTFYTPATASFASTAAIIIPDHGPATPYPAVTNVSGMTGQVSKVSVNLNGLTHSFPGDVSVLLVSPSGASALLMSHAGAGRSVTNLDLSFDDAAPVSLPLSAQITNGIYKPSAYNPAVTFTGTAPRPPYGAGLGALSGGNPNGLWSLYVLDDANGDAGNIAFGWTLTITTVQPVNPVADLAVAMSSAPSPLYTFLILTNNVTVTNYGPAAATGVVLTQDLPSGVAFVSAASSQGTTTNYGGTVTINLGSLAPGGAASASIRVRPSVATNLVSRITVVSANETDLNVVNNTAQTTSVVLGAPAVLSIRRVDPEFELTLTAPSGLIYSLQNAALLKANCLSCWSNLFTAVVPLNGSLKYTTTGATNSTRRYYRAVRVIP